VHRTIRQNCPEEEAEMHFWRKDRRLDKRLTVSWNAVLKAHFVGFEEVMTVTVSNFCLKGVLLYTDNLSVLNQQLMISRHRPDLWLTIFTPDGEIESKVEIRWYTWSCEKNLFEVGVNFIDLLENNRPVVDRIFDGREYATEMALH
jgi:hypothetical protein